MKVSFIIPVLDAERHIRRCLGSIRAQAYPQALVEIIVLDGGCKDRTVEIAKEFEASVYPNPGKLAEYGVQAGVAKATGDIVVVFAADNELASREWIHAAVKAFEDSPGCAAVWGPLCSGPDDPPINRYFALIQSDPMTFFMNKNLFHYLGHKDTEWKRDRFVFRVDPKRPLVWGANGLALKRELIAPVWAQAGYLGDNDAFQHMIERGHNEVAYIPALTTYHHHVGEVKDWIRKWKRNFSQHFLDKLETRNTNWVFVENFRARLVLWLLYSTNPFISGPHSIYLSLRDKTPLWAYHPLLCFLQTFVYAYLMVMTPKGRKTILKIARGAV